MNTDGDMIILLCLFFPDTGRINAWSCLGDMWRGLRMIMGGDAGTWEEPEGYVRPQLIIDSTYGYDV
jgi:hypothetical protein